ncbi:radical SAM protein [bacterium]|nr:radical SAM protein [bacterium]MBU1918038.1 radical SAM protein [bacterium]
MITKAKAVFKYFLKIKFPMKVAHYITYRCNLKCDMCGRRAIESEQEITTEQAIQLQKDFRKKSTIIWSFSGGECLVRKDIIELSASVKKLGMDLIIVTNGILLPKKQEILEYADVINVSLDGNQESHEKLRGPNSYTKALEALELIKNTKKKRLKKVVNTILNNETIQQPWLEHMLTLAKEYNCQVGFNPIIVHRSDLTDNIEKTYMPTYEQFKAFGKWLEEKKSSKDAPYFMDSPEFFKAIGHYPTKPTRIKCYAGMYQCSIDPFGRVLPCSDFFDYENSYEEKGLKWGCGSEGFDNLKVPNCPYPFCCTAKKNFFYDNPSMILKEYVLRKTPKQ